MSQRRLLSALVETPFRAYGGDDLPSLMRQVNLGENKMEMIVNALTLAVLYVAAVINTAIVLAPAEWEK